MDKVSKPEGEPPTSQAGGHPIRSEHVRDWDRILVILNRGHWDAARSYERKDFVLGTATLVAGFVAGSSAFTQLSEYAKGNPGDLWIQVLVGTLAFAAGLLGAAQTRFGFSNLASTHKRAGQKYGMLRREFDEFQEIGFSTLEEEEAELKAFRKKWDAVEAEFPPVPERQMRRLKTGTGSDRVFSSRQGIRNRLGIAVPR